MASASQNGQQATATASDDLVSPKSALAAIWLEDQKHLLSLRRFKLAEQWGVPSSLMEPAHGNVTINQTTPAPVAPVAAPPVATPVTVNGNGNTLLKGALLGAGILGLGGAAGLGLSYLNNRATSTVEKKTEFAPGDYDVKWKFNPQSGKLEFDEPKKVIP